MARRRILHGQRDPVMTAFRPLILPKAVAPQHPRSVLPHNRDSPGAAQSHGASIAARSKWRRRLAQK